MTQETQTTLHSASPSSHNLNLAEHYYSLAYSEKPDVEERTLEDVQSLVLASTWNGGLGAYVPYCLVQVTARYVGEICAGCGHFNTTATKYNSYMFGYLCEDCVPHFTRAFYLCDCIDWSSDSHYLRRRARSRASVEARMAANTIAFYGPQGPTQVKERAVVLYRPQRRLPRALPPPPFTQEARQYIPVLERLVELLGSVSAMREVINFVSASGNDWRTSGPRVCCGCGRFDCVFGRAFCQRCYWKNRAINSTVKANCYVFREGTRLVVRGPGAPDQVEPWTMTFDYSNSGEEGALNFDAYMYAGVEYPCIGGCLDGGWETPAPFGTGSDEDSDNYSSGDDW